MNRQQKEAVVSDVKKLFQDNQAAFLVCYKGLSVAKVQALRKDIRAFGGTFKVTKARLMKIAAESTPNTEDFRKDFKNQVGLIFVKEEVPGVAKKLVAFAKENELLNVISGFFESHLISKKEIEMLAAIPSRDVLIAQLMGTLQAPICALARVLNVVATNTPAISTQVSEKGDS
jgi:large subunit ribosomal protein L10